MRKKIITLFLGFALLVMAPMPLRADMIKRGGNAIHSIRGLLVDIHHGHQMITVEEEFSKLRRSFHVPFKRIDHFKVGDEIRVYFRYGRREALSVTKMTPIEYRREGQNKGYLLHSGENEDQNLEL